MAIGPAEQAGIGRPLCAFTSGLMFHRLKASFAVRGRCCGSIMSLWQCTLCPQVSRSEHPSDGQFKRQSHSWPASLAIADLVSVPWPALNYRTRAQLTLPRSALPTLSPHPAPRFRAGFIPAHSLAKDQRHVCFVKRKSCNPNML